MTAADLLENQTVDGDQEGRPEAHLREKQIYPVQTKRELIPEQTHVGLAEAWPIADNETAFAGEGILQSGQLPQALAPGGVDAHPAANTATPRRGALTACTPGPATIRRPVAYP